MASKTWSASGPREVYRAYSRRTIQATADGDRITATVYDVLGQPTQVSRSSSTGPESSTRVIAWDSLGRLRSNDEPNTEDPVAGRFWRYAWDDNNRLVGTGNAWGSGKDIYDDALGRTGSGTNAEQG